MPAYPMLGALMQRASISKSFREPEKKAVATPGALYFTYWIYDDPVNQTPARVEQGLLVAGRKPEIRTHAN